MNKQSGFTLIELVMVIVIIGILAAMAVPRFYDASADALTAAKEGTEGGVRAAYAIAIAELKTSPTLTQLAARVTSNGSVATVSPGGIGVRVRINLTDYDVQTYTDNTCLTATSAGGDIVRCVGNITP